MCARYYSRSLEYVSDQIRQRPLPLEAYIFVGRNRKQVVNSKEVKLYRIEKVIVATEKKKGKVEQDEGIGSFWGGSDLQF